MLCIGYDLGSSSIKASLLDSATGKTIVSVTVPETEMSIDVPQRGWAEQSPELWWTHIKIATAALMSKSGADKNDIASIGIAYQMHGLVLVDKAQQLLRPAIIWCDSRAVQLGDDAFEELGTYSCLQQLLNSPGNFTAAKLRWVQLNEPEIYARIHKAMLPGDYIAMRMTGRIATTNIGLSEAVLWNYKQNTLAHFLLDYWQISPDLLPEVLPVFGEQGQLSAQAAAELGLSTSTRVTYRSGDQPNNAFALKVTEPGEVAATAGTSAVIYSIIDAYRYDSTNRINSFLHVTHRVEVPRIGLLMCINGAGIFNSWLRRFVFSSPNEALAHYEAINAAAAAVPPGCEGLMAIPFGNGAERIISHADIGASFQGIQLNKHHFGHMARATQEGIVFAMKYGLELMTQLGVKPRIIRACNANMFLSDIFSQAFADITGAVVELYNTDGSQGAARAAALGAGYYQSLPEAFTGLHQTRTIQPEEKLRAIYTDIFEDWVDTMHHQITLQRI